MPSEPLTPAQAAAWLRAIVGANGGISEFTRNCAAIADMLDPPAEAVRAKAATWERWPENGEIVTGPVSDFGVVAAGSGSGHVYITVDDAFDPDEAEQIAHAILDAVRAVRLGVVT